MAMKNPAEGGRLHVDLNSPASCCLLERTSALHRVRDSARQAVFLDEQKMVSVFRLAPVRDFCRLRAELRCGGNLYQRGEAEHPRVEATPVDSVCRIAGENS